MNRRATETAIDFDADPETMWQVLTRAGFESMNRVLKARALKACVEAPETKD